MWEQWQHTSAADSPSLRSVHWFPWDFGRPGSFAHTSPCPAVPRGTGHRSRTTPDDLWCPGRDTWTEIRKCGRRLQGRKGVEREIMTQEILRLQMRLKGENIMGVTAEGYIIAVIEHTCKLYLISLTTLIWWFKSSKHLGKLCVPLQGLLGDFFFFKMTRDSKKANLGVKCVHF